MSKTLITSRDPKGLQAVSIFEAAYNKAKLDDPRAQRLNERGDELKAGISRLIDELSVSDLYADEDATYTSFNYPGRYRPEPIEQQILGIAVWFDLDPTSALLNLDAIQERPLPEDAEALFAIPSVNALARKRFPGIIDPMVKYHLATQVALEQIAAYRPLYDLTDGLMAPNHLRSHIRTASAMEKIAGEQPGDIFIVAAQLGRRHAGRSVRRARECFAPNEFGLDALAVGSILVTHPTRLVDPEDLELHCPGDEFYDLDSDVPFDHTFHFCFLNDGIAFGRCGVSSRSIDGQSGPASAFLPDF